MHAEALVTGVILQSHHATILRKETVMGKCKLYGLGFLLAVAVAAFFSGAGQPQAQAQTADRSLAATQAKMAEVAARQGLVATDPVRMRRMTPAQREAAAKRAAVARAEKVASGVRFDAPVPGGTPDYFGIYPNWANSPVPTVDPVTKKLTGGIRKFVDTLPGVGAANANNLGQYIPIAIADTTTYRGCDYYELGLVDYTQQMHSDLPGTKLRGYIDLAPTADGSAHYLGPIIIAQRDRAVRIKFTNSLATGAAGDLFIPADTTTMGAGMGPDGASEYTQNRAVIHLHGGATPWISDGTPHQWITPAGETATYTKGDSQENVPDMPNPGDGSATYYYTNQQSARLMFYHDHAYGLTRLNVYAGEAAGYILTDPVEEYLIASGVIPDLGGVYHYGIPLVIQDKTFVDETKIAAQDPTWNWGTTPPAPHTGDLWFPHVYMPNQNPENVEGANAMGRVDYGPWFWPIFSMVDNPPIADVPSTPNPSIVPEAFMDTPLVNGTAYPYLNVERKAYRFRILNACNDRFLNLQLYYAEPGHPTEVKMVRAIATRGFPATWPTDGREGGVPDPRRAGPSMIQIGDEGGLLPAPAVLTNMPIGYEYNRRDITVLNVLNRTLFLGPAERADVIIDFSRVPNGAKIILYSDAPSPVPASDPRNDYYTGDPDLTSTGGAPTTLRGYGPNTRTIMQFRVKGPRKAAPFNLAALEAALPAAYGASQPTPIVPQAAYGPAFGTTFTDTFARIQDRSLTFTPVGEVAPATTDMEPKAIQELFEMNYGRMNATLGVELPFTNSRNQTTLPFGYIDPPTEIIPNGGTQIWKITHNGVDTHAIHFHLFNVQLVNRVGWDGMIRPPDANEVGWKETVRMNPLEDAIVALKAEAPRLPFSVPESVRLLNPTMPVGSTEGFFGQDPLGNPVVIENVLTNFGWEYVWHCHLLGHEENDMMRAMALTDVLEADYLTPVALPLDLAATVTSATQVDLAWTDNSGNETGFRIERAAGAGPFAAIGSVLADVAAYSDATAVAGTTYTYRVFGFDGTGDSLPSNTATVTVTAPAAPIALAGAAAAGPAANLTWADNSNNESGFTINRATNPAFTKGLTVITVGANVTAYADGTVAAATRYFYRVQATNGIGGSAWSRTIRVKIP